MGNSWLTKQSYREGWEIPVEEDIAPGPEEAKKASQIYSYCLAALPFRKQHSPLGFLHWLC